jgi:hypothetical protein
MLLPEPLEKPLVPVSPVTVHEYVVPATTGSVVSEIDVDPPLQKDCEEGVATATGTGFTVQDTELTLELQPVPSHSLLASTIVVSATPFPDMDVMDGIVEDHAPQLTPLLLDTRYSFVHVPVPLLPPDTLTVNCVPAQTVETLGDFVILGAIGSGTTVISTAAVGKDSQDTPPTVDTVIRLNQVVWVNAPGE